MLEVGFSLKWCAGAAGEAWQQLEQEWWACTEEVECVLRRICVYMRICAHQRPVAQGHGSSYHIHRLYLHQKQGLTEHKKGEGTHRRNVVAK